MRILVAESAGFSPAAEARLRELGHVTMADLDQAELLGVVGSADVLVVRLRNRVNQDVLAAAPFLRAVVSPTTGLDHLELAALDRRGIAVLSLRGELEFLRRVPATAEHTWRSSWRSRADSSRPRPRRARAIGIGTAFAAAS